MGTRRFERVDASDPSIPEAAPNVGSWDKQVEEVSMTTSSDHVPPRPADRVPLDELARRKGVRPVESMDDLVCDVFNTDEELEEFLTSTYAARRATSGNR
jgi:hypothetical protein